MQCSGGGGRGIGDCRSRSGCDILFAPRIVRLDRVKCPSGRSEHTIIDLPYSSLYAAGGSDSENSPFDTMPQRRYM